jgi:hypothetical protein
MILWKDCEAARRFCKPHDLSFVMPGLVPGIHVFLSAQQDVDGRDEPGHDVERLCHAPIALARGKSLGFDARPFL